MPAQRGIMSDRNHEQPGRERGSADCFADVLDRHLSRRQMLAGAAAAVPLLTLPAALTASGEAHAATGNLTFTPVPENLKDGLFVPDGYTADIVIRWGDPLVAGMKPFDVKNQTPEDQAKRFGFNND